jgi:hypothetical protein
MVQVKKGLTAACGLPAAQAEDEAVLLRLGLAVMAALQQGLLELDDFEALITHLKVRRSHLSSVITIVCSQGRLRSVGHSLRTSPLPAPDPALAASSMQCGCIYVCWYFINGRADAHSKLC